MVTKSQTEGSTIQQLDKINMLKTYLGKKMKDISSDAVSTFYDLKKSAVTSWGIIYVNKCLRLCFANDKSFAIIQDADITGCLFKSNLGLPEMQEALVLLVAHAETSEASALCFGKVEYKTFSQTKVDEFLLLNKELCGSALRTGFPVSPSSREGESISQYINAVLQWGNEPHTEIFTIVKKGAFSASNPPKEITKANVNEMFDSFLENYQHLNIFKNKTFEVPIERCHLAPNHVKCRDFDKDYASDLKDAFFGYSSINF